MPLRLGTAEPGGTFYTQGEAIAELYNRGRAEYDRCVVLASQASIDNANRLDQGELEFGFMASNWIGRAKDGMRPFTRRIALRMVAPANAGPIFFVTLARSSIKSVDDLRGKRVVLGIEGSGMVEHVRTIFSVLSIAFDDFTPVYQGYADAADALITGDVDALFQPPIPNRMMTKLSERADLRVVPYSAGEIDKILTQVPYYRRVDIERGTLRGVSENVPQIAVVNVLVTHERVQEQPVHALAKTVVTNLDLLPKMNPLFKGLKDLFEPLRTSGAAAFEFGAVPLHPGAQRAYRDSGYLQGR
jgi:TRAP transporter TAXI family solute receptor